MKLNIEKLRLKGWTEEEINHTKEVLLNSENKKTNSTKIFEKITEWVVLLSIIIGSIVGAWIIEPLLLVLNKTGAIIAIWFSGILFGLFASIIIQQIETIEKKHHLIISLTIPITTIIASMIITQQTNKITELTKIGINHNPYLLGTAYLIGVLIPYGIFIYLERTKNGTL